jgi:PTH1 family peptidyl-tRNA hydrolase
MQLVVGLGNPGREYRDNRHNIGFRCLERLAASLGLRFAPATPRYRAATGEGPAGPLVLLQPLAYMNRSGEALRAWSAATGVRVGPTPPDVPAEPEAAAGVGRSAVPTHVVPVIVCDDLNLPLGSIRIRAGGSDGGQNGLASVIAALGGEAIPRMRLGVGPLGDPVPPEDWSDYVLRDFDPDEEPAVTDLLDAAAAALEDVLRLGVTAAASRHNRRIRPPRDLPDGGP